MAGRGKRPSEEKKYSRTWDVIQCEPGERIPCYVAGPHIRVKCHKEAYPKVCLKEHANATDCPGCKKGFDTTWYAWLPVYREPDKHELMAAFGEHQWDTLDALNHLQPATIGRECATGKTCGFKCPLWINPLSTRQVYSPADNVRKRERCIAMPLIILWKYTDRITVDQLLAEEPATGIAIETAAILPVATSNVKPELTEAEKAIERELRAKIAKGFKSRGEVGGIIAGVEHALGMNGRPKS